METPFGFRPVRRASYGVWVLLILPVIALQAFAQEASEPAPEPAPAPTAPSDVVPSEEPVDLGTLVLREQSNLAGADAGKSVISIRGEGDGTVEVRDAEGNLLEAYPAKHFTVSGKVKNEAVDTINTALDAKNKALADRKAKEEVEALKEQEAAKAAEETKKKEAEAAEVKWKEDFAAKSTPYYNWKENTKVNAVKIDAREIREDGTILYEGKSMKPARLWNDRLGQFEMAIPVPAKAE
jgi:hypothetical protein